MHRHRREQPKMGIPYTNFPEIESGTKGFSLRPLIWTKLRKGIAVYGKYLWETYKFYPYFYPFLSGKLLYDMSIHGPRIKLNVPFLSIVFFLLYPCRQVDHHDPCADTKERG